MHVGLDEGQAQAEVVRLPRSAVMGQPRAAVRAEERGQAQGRRAAAFLLTARVVPLLAVGRRVLDLEARAVEHLQGALTRQGRHALLGARRERLGDLAEAAHRQPGARLAKGARGVERQGQACGGALGLHLEDRLAATGLRVEGLPQEGLEGSRHVKDAPPAARAFERRLKEPFPEHLAQKPAQAPASQRRRLPAARRQR